MPGIVAAYPTGSVVIDFGDSFSKTISSGSIDCAYVNGSYTAGRVLDASGTVFLSFTQDIKNLKKKLKSAPDNKKPSIQKKIKAAKAKASEGNPVCAGGPDTLPFPTPTPGGGAPNFDSAGNVTESGKVVFGIPSNLSANISAGLAVYNSFCTGCHTAKLNRDFQVYRDSIVEPPMLYGSDDISDAMLANLTAYLNRFQMP